MAFPYEDGHTAMHVVDVEGYDTAIVIGPDQGATRLCLWAVTEESGLIIAPHHHHGEEIFRVLYGRLWFTVGGQTHDVTAGKAVIVPAGTTHSHAVIEEAEIEIVGQIGAGIFVWAKDADGEIVEEEIFVRGVPWSRTPPPGAHFLTPSEQARLYRHIPSPHKE